MRYPQAVELTQPQAQSIIATIGATLCDLVVNPGFYGWHDVGSMTRGELEAVVGDLANAQIAPADA